ncbi:MAG: DUF3084 domain-containing protein [Fimbriimonas sp.]
MILLPIGFLLLVVALGGLTAYYADQLGRTLGKKRLVIWGLRPRHTAALITTGAGMAIPLVTIFILTAASADFRRWVLEAPRALEERDNLRVEVGGLRSQEIDLRKVNQTLEQQKADREKVLRATEGKLTAATKQLKALELSIIALNDRVRRSSDLIARLNGQVQWVQNEYQKSLQDLKRERSFLAKAKSEFGEAYRQRNEAYAELTRIQNDNASLEAALGRIQETVGDLTKQKTQLADDIVTARKAFDSVLTGNQQELSRVQVQLELKKQELDEVSGRLEASTRMLMTSVEVSRTRALTFRIGEEVARVSIPSDRTPGQILGILNNLVKNAQEKATARGAKARGAIYPVAGIFPRTSPSTGQPIPTNAVIEAIIQRIGVTDGPIALVAVSSLNAFEEEPVSLEIGILANPIIYRAGDTIAETKIDGTRDTSQIYAQVADFLEYRVKSKLKSDRMLTRDIESQPLLGIPTRTVLDLVSQIRTANRTIRLIMLSNTETRAADPLKPDFKIR